MPMVPKGTNLGAYGQSPLGGGSAKPSETDLLMAAADMHGQGRLIEPPKEEQRSMPQGPERPRINLKRKSNRPLKVVK